MSSKETFFTDDSGKLTRKFVPAVTYSLLIRAEGYESKTVPSIAIENKITADKSVTLTRQ
jgi:hypothetical protein